MAKILIMDDEPALRDILSNTLKSMGHVVVIAEDGRQAVEVAKKESPDLALLDIQVPDMDGIEVLREMKKLDPSVKGIILSGSSDVNIAVSTMKQGASDFIGKPFKIDEVKSVVNKVLQSKTPAMRPSAQVSSPVSGAKEILKPIKKDASPKTAFNFSSPIAVKTGLALLVVFIGIAGIFISKNLFKKQHFIEYAIPYSNPTGMCWIAPHLWVSDWITGNIYKHNIDSTLSVAAVYKTANTQPTGITYNGEYLWSGNSIEQQIYKHNKDESLTVRTLYSTPDSNPIALYFDGVNLWVLDSNAAKIYRHKMDDTLSVTGTFDSPAINPCGMFRDGEYFYIGDYKTARIYKVLVKDFSVSDVFLLQYFADKKYKLASITWDGKYIWAAADEAGKIFKAQLKDLTPIKF